MSTTTSDSIVPSKFDELRSKSRQLGRELKAINKFLEETRLEYLSMITRCFGRVSLHALQYPDIRQLLLITKYEVYRQPGEEFGTSGAPTAVPEFKRYTWLNNTEMKTVNSQVYALSKYVCRADPPFKKEEVKLEENEAQYYESLLCNITKMKDTGFEKIRRMRHQIARAHLVIDKLEQCGFSPQSHIVMLYGISGLDIPQQPVCTSDMKNLCGWLAVSARNSHEHSNRICFECGQFLAGTISCVSPCGHEFHLECIMDGVARSGFGKYRITSCPLCQSLFAVRPGL